MAESELKSWLASKWLISTYDLLVSKGWDSLDKLSRCNDNDIINILNLYIKPGHKLKMRVMLNRLRLQNNNNNPNINNYQQKRKSSVDLFATITTPIKLSYLNPEKSDEEYETDDDIPPPPPDFDENIISSLPPPVPLPPASLPSLPPPPVPLPPTIVPSMNRLSVSERRDDAEEYMDEDEEIIEEILQVIPVPTMPPPPLPGVLSPPIPLIPTLPPFVQLNFENYSEEIEVVKEIPAVDKRVITPRSQVSVLATFLPPTLPNSLASPLPPSSTTSISSTPLIQSPPTLSPRAMPPPNIYPISPPQTHSISPPPPLPSSISPPPSLQPPAALSPRAIPPPNLPPPILSSPSSLLSSISPPLTSLRPISSNKEQDFLSSPSLSNLDNKRPSALEIPARGAFFQKRGSENLVTTNLEESPLSPKQPEDQQYIQPPSGNVDYDNSPPDTPEIASKSEAVSSTVDYPQSPSHSDATKSPNGKPITSRIASLQSNFLLEKSSVASSSKPNSSGPAVDVSIKVIMSKLASQKYEEEKEMLREPIQIIQSSDFAKKQALLMNLQLGVNVGSPPPPPPAPRVDTRPTTLPKISPRYDENADEDGDNSLLPLTSSLVNAEQAGFLNKRSTGLFNSSYKQRYCIFKGKVLYWMKNKYDERPLGMLHINDNVTINLTDSKTMEIVTNKKTYVFQAYDHVELDLWYNKLVTPLSLQGLDEEDYFNQKMSLLKIGEIFKKYKNSENPKRRLLWVSASLDKLYWGDENKNIRGEIELADIIRIDEGCPNAAMQDNAFEIVTLHRTLELEANTKLHKKQFIDAIMLLLERT